MTSQVTVFLVDDDHGALRSLAWFLKEEGYWVQVYSSAKAFLNEYDPERPGCLVLDYRMPEMDGLQLQEELTSRGLRVPIVFVSGHGDVPISVRAMKGGAIDFLEKPVDNEKLLLRVEEALEKDRAWRDAAVTLGDIKAKMERLTPREQEVMELLYTGKSTKVIAAEFKISNQTAAKHRTSVLEKLEVGGEADLARLLDVHRLAKV